MESIISFVLTNKCAVALCFFVCFWILRFFLITFQKLSRRKAIGSLSSLSSPSLFGTKRKKDERVPLLAVLGSGGHSAEMIRLLSSLDLSCYSPRMYAVAATDALSKTKIEQFEKENGKEQPFTVHVIGRSREVGQSYFTSIFTTTRAIFESFFLFIINLPTTPELILCNGPGTCVPVCWGSYLPLLFCFRRIKIVYVESLARVNDLSLSAKVLFPFADRIFVQWPQLTQKYGNYVEFHGRLG